MLNKNICSKNIIKTLSIALGIFSIVGELLSLDKIHSLQYCCMGLIIAIISYIYSNKISLFSPIYNCLNTIFFSYVFSGLYYFFYTEDVMGNNALLNKNLMSEINIIYLAFFFSLFIPICLYLMSKKKYLQFAVLDVDFPSKNFNLYLTIFNLIWLFFIIIILKFANMNLIEAFLSSGEFRYTISNGSVSMAYTLMLTAFSCILVLVIKDLFNKTQYFSIINKFCLILLFTVWALICGSKGVLIYTGILPFLIIFCIFKQIKVKHIILVILGIILVLTYSSVLNKFRASGLDMVKTNDYSSLKEIKLLKTLAGRNDNFANSVQFFAMLNNEGSVIYFNNYHYKDEILTHMIKFMPKTIRNKLITSELDLFGTKMSKLIYPNAVEYQHGTFEFGVISNIFWSFGIVGTVFIGFIIGCFIVILEMLFNMYKTKDMFLVFYISILYPLIMTIFSVGLINTANTMKLFYVFPLVILIVCFFRKNSRIIKIRGGNF